MMSNFTEKHTENVYAFDENQAELYILDVPYEERGERKPYFCLGCMRKMQAVYRKKEKERHFRHSVVIIPGEKKCTYHDETYRHKLAKTIIQGLKKIKVPRVYKFHPDKKENNALSLKEATYIEGAFVEIEKYIYEDENGEIEFSNSENNSKDRNLLIKPDAMLLDRERKPILLIEFVATHKPDVEKLAKIKRLGIDCIQVTIPKSSPEEIENTFHKTERTKWLYNNEEDNTDYFQLSGSYSGGIYEVDHEQRKLSEEGFKCRRARIKSLVRRIELILRSKPYKDAEERFRSELFRNQENTKRATERLDGIRSENLKRGIEKHRERRGALETEQGELRQSSVDLEARYLKRSGELREEARTIESEIAEVEFKVDGIDTGGKTNGDFIKETRESINYLGTRRDEIVRLKEKAGIEFENSEGELRARIGAQEERLQEQIDSIPEQFERDRDAIEEKYRSDSNQLQREIEEITIEEGGLGAEFDILREEIATRIDREKKELVKGFEVGDLEGGGWIAEELRKLHDFKQSILVYQSALSKLERIEQEIREKNNQ